MDETQDEASERTETGGSHTVSADDRVTQQEHAATSRRNPALSLAPGAALARYVVSGVVGSGASGVVYEAYDPELDRRIALKVIRPDVPGGPRVRERFLREARALAQLSHPNVVQVYDVGVVQQQVFIAMELVRGVTLRHKLSGSVTWQAALAAYLQAARGLAAAHAIGMVHRDFKPDNVLYGEDDRVRVVDFGLVTLEPFESTPPAFDRQRALGPALEATPGLICGTPAYMALEAIRGGRVDARVDQFSFCVAVFHHLYGEFPFSGDTLAEREAQILRGPVACPSGSSVPESLYAVLRRGLSAHPADRYPSMFALIGAIDEALAPSRGARARHARMDYRIERQRHDRFVGRSEVLARLDQLLVEDRVDRWVAVTGGPGMGKSAILAAWLARREAQGAVVPHHFIRRGEYDWDDASKLVRSLVAQIDERFPEQRDLDASEHDHPASRLAAALTRVSLAVLAPRGERLVVLIDGLDEFDPSPGPHAADPLAAFLPHSLPRGVSILCASRPRHPHVTMLEARDGELVRIDLDDPDLAADNDATIRLLWQRAERELELEPALVEEAIARAAGNPQHAVTLHKHLASHPATRRRFEGVPRGLEALLVRLWERIAAEPVAVRGLGILCAAREPLSLDEIAQVASCGDDTIQRGFLRTAGELVVESRRGDGVREYRLHHDAIREHIAATLGASRLQALHADLATRLAIWPVPATATAASRRYTLRHALSHLAGAGAWPQAWRLAADMAFLEAKCREFGAHDAETDVARAAARCRAAGDELHARRLEQLARALERESHWLRSSPEAIAALVWNRLRRSGWTADELDEQLRIPAGTTFARVRDVVGRSSPALVRDFVGHAAAVSACAVSPDGRRLISACEDGTLGLWDLETGRVISMLQGHADRATACAVTPDGRSAVSGCADGTLAIWDLESGRAARWLRGHTDCVTGCAVTPDGRRILSASEDRTLRLWDLGSGRPLTTLRGHTAWITACAVTPDGRHAVSASCDHTLKIWDLVSGRATATLTGHTGWVTACAVTPDGQRAVSASEDGTLRVWDLASGDASARLVGHTGWVTGCAVTPDGQRVVSSSYDHTLKIWDIARGVAISTLEGHADWVTCCALAPHGQRVVSASEDQTLKLWELDVEPAERRDGHRTFVTSCTITPDGRYAISASSDHTMKRWDIATARVVTTFEGHTGWVTACAVTPDGQHVLSSSDDQTLKLWDVRRGELIRTFTGHGGWVFGCAISPDGRRAASGEQDGTLKIWDLPGATLITSFKAHEARVSACAISPDGLRVISASFDNTLRVWELDGAHLLASFVEHTGIVSSCCITRDGRRVISTSWDNTIKIWDIDSGRTLATLAGHTASVYGCAQAPDGRHLVSASYDGMLKVWDLDTGRCILSHRGDTVYYAVTVTATTIVAGDLGGAMWFIDWPIV